jgi:UDP-N-acetylglucosamine transferase subunit ALG13
MIFVSVGTNEAPFDRLLRAVEGFPGGEELVVQHGSSGVRPANATCVDYLSFGDLVEHVRRARVVVTHAGMGSMMVALANGKRPVVVPRLKRFHEAVDDHQIPLARRLEDRDLVTLVEQADRLRDVIENHATATLVSVGDDGRLSGDLREYLSRAVGRT